MTRDDIMRMAKNEYGIYAFTAESLAHFAALVAAEKDKEIERLQDMLYELLGELTALLVPIQLLQLTAQ